MNHLETPRPSTPSDHGDGDSITGLLLAWRQGRPNAGDQLMARIYPQLCAMATARLPGDGRAWTLQPTDVVHEAYLKLRQQRAPWRNQAQFFKLAARLIQRVIADHARHRGRQKRGDGRARLPLSQVLDLAGPPDRDPACDLLADLSRIDARAARVVELRVGCCMTGEEVASCLGVSSRTVARDWRFARAWMRNQLTGSRDPHDGDAMPASAIADMQSGDKQSLEPRHDESLNTTWPVGAPPAGDQRPETDLPERHPSRD